MVFLTNTQLTGMGLVGPKCSLCFYLSQTTYKMGQWFILRELLGKRFILDLEFSQNPKITSKWPKWTTLRELFSQLILIHQKNIVKIRSLKTYILSGSMMNWILGGHFFEIFDFDRFFKFEFLKDLGLEIPIFDSMMSISIKKGWYKPLRNLKSVKI